MYRRMLFPAVMLLALCSLSLAEDGSKQVPAPAANQPQSAADQIIDRVFYQEAKLVETMHKYSPIVETYIQNTKPDHDLGEIPVSDSYFIGRMNLNEKGLLNTNFEDNKKSWHGRILDRLTGVFKMNYLPLGFMQLVMLNHEFDRQHYDLKFVRRQFIGQVRTMVFDVQPKPKLKGPHFLGRIWVEDQGYNIVRFNGTYEPQSRANYFFHFDSWRMNMQPGVWLPVTVYTEESDTKYMVARKLQMKGQTRLWGYDKKHSGQQQELTAIDIDDENAVDKSDTAANEFNPVKSDRQWHREAEDNVLDRMERAGLLSPEGSVSKVLETVVNNIVVTNNLSIDPEVRCRVLLTTPLETFTIGNTIVISRGLLDVLPDEASLAMVLSHELAHIVLGHQLDTKYAFSDRQLYRDEQSFQKVGLRRTDREETDADQKAVQLLQKSPYQAKLASAGLFLKALQERSGELSALTSPHFGNRIAKKDEVIRMNAVQQGSPQLELKDVKQVAALPLGSRIYLDPWNDRVEMKKTPPVALESAREKMPFEVTPAFLNLVRYQDAQQPAANAANQANPVVKTAENNSK